jgi:hypothetical protein
MQLWIITLSLVTVCGEARADPWLLPAPGEVVSRAVVETSLTRHRVMQPVSIAPDLVVGVSARLALAVHHSRMFDGRLGAGNGICVVGARETLGSAPADCGSGYTGAGVSLLAGLTSAVTARAGLSSVDIDPMKLALTTGVIVRVGGQRSWFVAAPAVAIGLSNRDAGNRDRILAPIYVGANLWRGELHARSGFEATLETAAETFTVPLGAGGSVAIRHDVRMGAEVTLDRALGMLNAMSWRSGSVYVELDHGGGS